jgi:AMP-binding enzyme/Acyl-CoA dehydrogenase, N-terminal domain
MALILTEEQTMVRDNARAFLADKAALAHLRKLRDTRDADGFSRSLWKAFAEMGFCGLLLPESLGGSGLGYVEGGVIMEIGRNLTPSPFLSTALLGATALLRDGNGARNKGRLKEKFPKSAPGFGWGMTETTSVFTGHSDEDYELRPESSGPALPVCEMKIVDEDGREMPPGGVGELWAKGTNVVRGYWRNPEATAATFLDGWLRTGDIARIHEEGFLFILDRAKDMLIRGGENIYCIEVENALYEHPAVIDAAVVAIPHRSLGEDQAPSSPSSTARRRARRSCAPLPPNVSRPSRCRSEFSSPAKCCHAIPTAKS